jgi:hypothetical protein
MAERLHRIIMTITNIINLKKKLLIRFIRRRQMQNESQDILMG